MKSKYFTFAMVLLFTVIGGDRYRAEAQQSEVPPEVLHYADTVIYNGKVMTADKNFSIAQAVAIREGKFLAIGDTKRILAMAGPNTRKIDLKGKAVVPGIIDLHQHPFTEGMLSYWADKWFPNEPEWTTANAAAEAIKRAIAKVKPGEPILVPRIYIGPAANEQGGRVGEAICDMLTVEQKYTSPIPCAVRNAGNLCRVLSREQLDSVSPNNPVVFVGIVDLEPYAINSKAAEVIKPYVKGNTEIFEKAGSACVVTGRESRLPGGDAFAPRRLVKDFLMFWNEPLENQLVAYRNASKGISAAGITLTKEHTALPVISGIRELWLRGELTVRMRMPYPITPLTAVGNAISIDPQEAELLFRRLGNMSGVGDDMLRFVGIRPPAVGGNMVGGAVWSLQPRIRTYTNREGVESKPYGGGGPGEGQFGPLQPGQEIINQRSAIVQAIRFGWSVSTDHTIGDRAVREVINAMEEGLKTQVVKTTNQRLHVGHTPLATIEDIRRMKQLGIRTSVGPWHIFLPDMLDAGVYQFGTEQYGKMALPMKSYVREGLPPALEGDVAGAIFWRMEKVITRKDDLYKRAWNPAEAVSRQEALWMATIYGAEELAEDTKLGTIEVGKLADVAVIDKDYMTVPEDTIHEIKVLLTMVGGKVVFEKSGGLQ